MVEKYSYFHCVNCGHKLENGQEVYETNNGYFCSNDCYIEYIQYDINEDISEGYIYCENCGDYIEEGSLYVIYDDYTFCSENCLLEKYGNITDLYY